MKVIWHSDSAVEYFLFTSTPAKGSSARQHHADAPQQASVIERPPSAPASCSFSSGRSRKTARLYTEALLQVLERDKDIVRCCVRGRRVVFINRDAPAKINGARPDGFWKTITSRLQLVSVHQADVETDFEFWNEVLRVFIAATSMPSGEKPELSASSVPIHIVQRSASAGTSDVVTGVIGGTQCPQFASPCVPSSPVAAPGAFIPPSPPVEPRPVLPGISSLFLPTPSQFVMPYAAAQGLDLGQRQPSAFSGRQAS
eukprot:m51a1_g1732 hypothetical protein (257) ;mRNA; f:153135-154018